MNHTPPRTMRDVIAQLAVRGGAPAIRQAREADFDDLAAGELAARVNRLAGGLAGMLEPGEPVGLWALGKPETITAALAIMVAGGAVMPLDAQLTDEALDHILKDSGAKLVFAFSESEARFESRGLVVHVLDDVNNPCYFMHIADDEQAAPPPVEPGGLAALFYTSGTTGKPKGVPLTHGNLISNVLAIAQSGILKPTDRLLLPLPLHHVYPFVLGIFTPLSLGLPIVIPRSLTGPDLVWSLREGRITVVAGVPRLYAALVEGIQTKVRAGGFVVKNVFALLMGLSLFVRPRFGLYIGKLLFGSVHQRFGRELRVVATGGSAIDQDLAWFMEGLGWRVGVGYGLTETSPALTVLPPDKPKDLPLNSAGRAIAGVELKLSERFGEDGARLDGEVLAKGPNVFGGYLHLPEKTREAFTEDGWFRTGDLGRFDENGWLFLTGRASIMIVTKGGENVNPEVVEEVFVRNGLVAEAAVLERDGDLVVLVVPDPAALRLRGTLAEEAVREAVSLINRDLPSYQRVVDFAVSREPIERTRLGKIRRHKLAAQFAKAKGEATETPGPVGLESMSPEDQALFSQDPVAKAYAHLAVKHPDKRLSPDSSLGLDLGLDSLSWLTLSLELADKTGVTLLESDTATIDTVRDLGKALLARSETPGGAPRDNPLKRALESPETTLSPEQKTHLAPLSPLERVLARIVQLVLALVFRLYFRIKVEGLEHLPKSGAVIAPNHVSYLDPFFLCLCLPFSVMENTAFAAWTGAAFAYRLNRFFARLAQAVPIDADKALFSSLAYGAAVRKSGKNLVWFPEGARSRTGELMTFRAGLGLILAAHPGPVVPVHLKGPYEAMPPGKGFPKPGDIRIRIGAPVDSAVLMAEGGEGSPEARIMAGLKERVRRLGED